METAVRDPQNHSIHRQMGVDYSVDYLSAVNSRDDTIPESKLPSTKTDNTLDMEISTAVQFLADDDYSNTEMEPLYHSFGPMDWERPPQTLWDSARIQDSPTLTTLMIALKIEEEMPLLPPSVLPHKVESITLKQLDLASVCAEEEQEATESTAVVAGSAKHQGKRRKQQIKINFEFLQNLVEEPYTLVKEVSPFPISNGARKRSYGAVTRSSPSSLKLRISNCRAQLYTMQKTLPSDSSAILLKQEQLVQLLGNDHQYRLAEDLYVKILKTKQEVLGPNHVDVAWTYLNILWNRVGWGKEKQMLKETQKFHENIMYAYGPRTKIGDNSMRLLAWIYYQLYDYQQAEKLERQRLQIALNDFGMADQVTIYAMADLGMNLYQLNFGRADSADLLASTENLARYSIHIHRSILGSPIENMFNSYNVLVDLLISKKEYKESLAILRSCLLQCLEIFGLENEWAFIFSLQLTEVFRKCENLAAAEKVSKLLLLIYSMSELFVDEGLRIDILEELIFILEELGQWREASVRAEEAFRANYRLFGAEHKFTANPKDDLNYYYSKQGLYQDDEEFEERLEWILKQEGFTTIHFENGRDQPGVLEREIQELTEWFEAWVHGAPETQKKRKTETMARPDPFLTDG